MSKNSVLTLDIGSASLEATLSVQERSEEKIIFSSKVPIPVQEESLIESLLYHTHKSLRDIMKEISLAHVPRPNQVVCVLSSPWYISELRSINLSKETDFLFNQKLADNLLQKEAILFKEERFSDYGDMQKGILCTIESKIIKTSLNGYDTSVPFGQKARELAMDIFISLGIRKNMVQIEGLVKKFFPETKVKFFSLPFVFFSSLREMHPGEDFLLISVGGEVTDILVTKEDKISSLASFPTGSGSLVRKISQYCGCSFSESLPLFSFVLSGHASNQLNRNMQKAVQYFKEEWISSLEDTIDSSSHGVKVPSLIFLTTESDLSDLFALLVKEERIHQYTWTNNRFKVAKVPRESLKGLYITRLI